MAAYFIDFDGVFFKYGTLVPTDNAVETIMELIRNGHQIYFTTMRKYKNNDETVNLYKTEETLRNLGINYNGIIEGVQSPRIMVNDEGAIAINHLKNAPLTKESLG